MAVITRNFLLPIGFLRFTRRIELVFFNQFSFSFQDFRFGFHFVSITRICFHLIGFFNVIGFQLFVVDNLLERVEQREFLILVVLDVGVHLDVPEDILAEMTELPGILFAEEKKTISTPTINIINHSIKMSQQRKTPRTGR